jgi:hypothetical protein
MRLFNAAKRAASFVGIIPKLTRHCPPTSRAHKFLRKFVRKPCVGPFGRGLYQASPTNGLTADDFTRVPAGAAGAGQDDKAADETLVAGGFDTTG